MTLNGNGKKGILWATGILLTAILGVVGKLGIGYIVETHDASIKVAAEIRVLQEDVRDMKQWREGIQADRADRGFIIPDLKRRVELLEAKK